jgi:hypothetical protein
MASPPNPTNVGTPRAFLLAINASWEKEEAQTGSYKN